MRGGRQGSVVGSRKWWKEKEENRHKGSPLHLQFKGKGSAWETPASLSPSVSNPPTQTPVPATPKNAKCQMQS